MSEEKKGKGRPRKNTTSQKDEVFNNETEQGVNKNIQEESDITEVNNDVSNSSESDIPDNDDDLKSFIKTDSKIKKPLHDDNSNGGNDIDDSLDRELAEFESQEGLNDIPKNNYNPLRDAVKQRGYTDGKMGLNSDTVNPNGENVVYKQEEGKGQEKVISEPNYTGGGHSKKPDIDATLINPTNSGGDGVLDIPDDNQYNNQQQQQTKKPNNNANPNTNNNGGNNTTAKTENKVEKESNLKDLSPAEKKKEVEKTADALLLAYRNYVPMGFTYFASHDVKKLKELEKKGQLDLETPMNRKGETILDYIKEFNKDVEEAFRITDAEVEMIKPALVDVLMEQEIAFTPTQKLIFVLGQFLVAKIMLLIKFIRQKNADIKEFKKMHIEVLERAEGIRLQNEAIQRQNEEILAEMRKSNGQQNTQPQNTQQQNTNVSNLKVVKEDVIKKDNNEATIINETNSNVTITTEEKKPTLDDALETNVTEVVENENKDNAENDIPN